MQTTPGERLKVARKHLNLTLRGLAEPLGVAFQSVHNWEKNLSPIPKPVALGIERAHKISSDWLLTGEGDIFVNTNDQFFRQVYAGVGGKEEAGREDAALIPIPITTWRPTANPNLVESWPDGYRQLAFPAGWLKERIGVHQKYLSLLRVEEDSMAPTLSPGDIIMVDNTAPNLEFREGIWVFCLHNAIYIKRLQQLGDAQYRAICDNAQYSPITFERDNAIFFGRVVWLGKTI